MLKKIREKLKWLDPFTYADMYIMPKVNPENSALKANIVYIVFAFISAWLLYTGLGLILGTPNPLVIVVSGSMEPVYYRGDVILLTGLTGENLKSQEVDLGQAEINGKPITEFLRADCTLKNTGEKGTCTGLLSEKKTVQELKEALAGITTTSLYIQPTGQTIPITTEGDIVVYDSDVT